MRLIHPACYIMQNGAFSKKEDVMALKKKCINLMLVLFTMLLPAYLIAAENDYQSQLINQSNQHNSGGFKLIKTKMWPSSSCLLDTGKKIVNPGESTTLKIKKDKQCNECGIGYSVYRMEDTKNEHLLGYLSHRFADGKFSLQMSRFCEEGKCVFSSLNPEQSRTK